MTPKSSMALPTRSDEDPSSLNRHGARRKAFFFQTYDQRVSYFCQLCFFTLPPCFLTLPFYSAARRTLPLLTFRTTLPRLQHNRRSFDPIGHGNGICFASSPSSSPPILHSCSSSECSKVIQSFKSLEPEIRSFHSRSHPHHHRDRYNPPFIR